MKTRNIILFIILVVLFGIAGVSAMVDYQEPPSITYWAAIAGLVILWIWVSLKNKKDENRSEV
ncbi:hypothetical protein GF367_01265 [Candidatus Woesearchaeota archaeon]|nr:hypothetical protein [Candidatus Woesearchaeota archaeon]